MARKSRKPENLQQIEAAEQVSSFNTALYIRLSVMDSGKKDGESILNQQALLENYVSERPEFTLRSVFVDNGESGIDFVRPSWTDLMRECRTGNINCIVVKDLSRVGRNYIETGEYLEKIFPLLGVRLIAVNDSYDNISLTNGERIVANLKNLANDFYAKDISRKSSAALRTKQKQGAFIGTYASYGYLKDPNDKNKIIVDTETAPIVRQIFEWKADGVANAQICRLLTAKGVPAPNKYRLEKGLVKDEKYAKSEWAASVLKRILTCQVYLGNMEQGRKRGALYEGGGHGIIDKSEWTVVEGTHEPIISQDLFDRANAILQARTAVYKENACKYSAIPKPEMLLQDLVFCADCGRPLFRYKQVKGKYNRVYWTYQCRTHSNLKNCPIKYIHEHELYGAVYEAVRVEVAKCCDIKSIIEKLNRESSHKSRLTRFDEEIEKTGREIKRIASLRQAIYNDYAENLVTLSEYQFAKEKYDADTIKLHSQLETAQREKVAYTQNATPTNKWITAFSRFMDARELTAEMAKALIERIEVSNRNNVEVFFKFRDEYAAARDYSDYTKDAA